MKNNITRVITGVLIFCSLLVSGIYIGNRIEQTRKLKSQLIKVNEEARNMKAAREREAELFKTAFPEKADVASFVEALYSCALKTGVKNHEVITMQQKNSAPGGMRKNAGTGSPVLLMYPLKITMEGKYRQIAEYLKEMQKIERFKRVMTIEMKSGKGALTTSIVVEIMSAGGHDAA
jgi:Tfp pilus assembly protein PilO